MRIRDWSSDVCSSDLRAQATAARPPRERRRRQRGHARAPGCRAGAGRAAEPAGRTAVLRLRSSTARGARGPGGRSEEHTSELQSLMRISYAVFCLKKKNNSRARQNDTRTHKLNRKQVTK